MSRFSEADPSDIEFLYEFGQQLYHARIAAGLTATEVASRLEVPSQMITDVEEGKRDLTLSELRLYLMCIDSIHTWEVTSTRTDDESEEVAI